MIKKYRYCDDNVYKDDVFLALSSQFKDNRENFESFYSSLKDSELKDEFLRVGSMYLFFVNCGDWHVDVARSKSAIDYLTNSFKLVALLAIIESLSEKDNVDFFDWLLEQGRGDLFPIADKTQLKMLYGEYKSEYGSIRKCRSFFNDLSPATKDKLCKSITIDGKALQSIDKFVTMIYDVRSQFAHDIAAVLEISNSWCFSKEGNKKVRWNLSMASMECAFEEGILVHLKGKLVT